MSERDLVDAYGRAVIGMVYPGEIVLRLEAAP